MTEATAVETRILCELCRAKVHSIEHHLKEDHPEVTPAEYMRRFPGKPMMSAILEEKVRERERAAAKGAAAAAAETAAVAGMVSRPLHEVFGLAVPILASSGKPVMVSCRVRETMDAFDQEMIPDIDPNYVFNLDVLRTMILGVERAMPTYLWGHAGTGKTTFLEQIMARTNRPMIRAQHTANMEESHVVGQYLLRDGKTVFEPGPLMMAMQRGWTYLADEYDFGRPEVLAVYQPVLERKPLMVKEADLASRITRPHPQFRIFATGNTNGTGDETGLYQGTLVQNAANYERFAITERMPYMEPDLEARVVSSQGGIPVAEARKLVDFASRIREDFDGGKMANPISPRTLIYAAQVGKARASFRTGLQMAFINRLSSVDRETASQLAQRIFGAKA